MDTSQFRRTHNDNIIELVIQFCARPLVAACCNTSESQADSLAHKSRRQTSVVPNLDTGFKRVTKQYTIMFRRGVCFVVLIAVAQTTCGAFNIGKKGAVIHSIEPYRTWGASRHPTGSLAGSHNHPYGSCLPSVAQKRNNFESIF